MTWTIAPSLHRCMGCFQELHGIYTSHRNEKADPIKCNISRSASDKRTRVFFYFVFQCSPSCTRPISLVFCAFEFHVSFPSHLVPCHRSMLPRTTKLVPPPFPPFPPFSPSKLVTSLAFCPCFCSLALRYALCITPPPPPPPRVSSCLYRDIVAYPYDNTSISIYNSLLSYTVNALYISLYVAAVLR